MSQMRKCGQGSRGKLGCGHHASIHVLEPRRRGRCAVPGCACIEYVEHRPVLAEMQRRIDEPYVQAIALKMLAKYSSAAVAADMANEHAHDHKVGSRYYNYWIAVRRTIQAESRRGVAAFRRLGAS